MRIAVFCLSSSMFTEYDALNAGTECATQSQSSAANEAQQCCKFSLRIIRLRSASTTQKILRTSLLFASLFFAGLVFESRVFKPTHAAHSARQHTESASALILQTQFKLLLLITQFPGFGHRFLPIFGLDLLSA